MKKSKARVETKAESATYWEARIARGRAFIGPKMPLRCVRVIPLPPRENGRARMERPVNHAFDRMWVSGALTPGFVRENEIASMRSHLDDIASIIDETVADDDKAELLMRTIGYAFGGMFDLGRTEGGNEPGRRLRERDAARELGARERGKQLTAEAAEWHKRVRPIWWEKRGQHIDAGQKRPNLSQERLANQIIDGRHGKILGLPSVGQVWYTIKAWEREQRLVVSDVVARSDATT